MLRPSYDNQDNLWIVDKADSAAPRLRVRNRDGDVSTVKTSFHGDAPVVLRMAPDGVRALMVMKSKTTGQNYVQTGDRPVRRTAASSWCSGSSASSSLPLTGITDAAWNKQGILVVGASTTGSNPNRRPWLVNSDGSRLQLLPGSLPGFTARDRRVQPQQGHPPGHRGRRGQGALAQPRPALDADGRRRQGRRRPIYPVYPG